MSLGDIILLMAKGGSTTESDSDHLKQLLNVLGNADGDLRFFIPPFDRNPGAGVQLQDISSRGLHGSNTTAYDATSGHFIRGRMLAARLNGTDENWQIAHNALLTPVSGGVDTAFSVGCAFNLIAADANVKHLISKWDDQTPDLEWRLYLTALEYPALELFDNSVANANKGREDQTAVAANTWYIVIATYDGQGGPTPQAGINIYRWDGASEGWDGAVDDANIAGAGVYVDMEDTGIDVLIGAAWTAAGPAQAEWWPGDICMPFMTMRELSAGDCRKAAELMVHLMGL